MTTLADMSPAQKAEFLVAIADAISGVDAEESAKLSWQLRALTGWPKYWGTSSEPTLDAAGVQALQHSDPYATSMRAVLEMEREGAPAEYFYFAYPIRLGGYEFFYCGARPSRPSVSAVASDVVIEYPGGISVQYAVFRSPQPIAGSISFMIT